MKAIVLTYDRNREVTRHMIRKYHELWPGHPFCFRIPYQVALGEPEPSVEYVMTDKPIRSTVLELIEDLDDDEWVYWCIDDKYPIQLDTGVIEDIIKDIHHFTPDQCSGVAFLRIHSLKNGDAIRKNLIRLPVTLKGRDLVYLERRNYEQIWLHQFLRVKVLRHLFGSFPAVIANAKEMDFLIRNIKLPAKHRIHVTRGSHCQYGESMSRGLLTVNCKQSMETRGFDASGYEIDEQKTMILG